MMRYCLFVLLLLGHSAWAQQPQSATSAQSAAVAVPIGYTRVDFILSKMPEVAAVQKQLENLAQRHQAEYQQKLQDFDKQLQDYQRRVALMSPDARQRREQELATLQSQLQQFAVEKNRELEQKEAELMQPILDRIQKAIEEVARERRLALVLNTGIGASPILLYADDRYDITEAVLKKLGIN